MAQTYGVDIKASGLSSNYHAVGIALGTQSLTVTEQATMLSTIDNNGVYHQAHIVKDWQAPDGSQQRASVATHGVLDPSNLVTNAQLDSQVQYAMEMTTVDGTGTAAAYGLGNRPIIAKTGTTTGSKAGFFIGAIPQYSLVVGMFTHDQGTTSTESLVPLTGGGFGGYWPAKIWNTFAQAEFADLPTENFQNPVFTGAAWNQVGKLPATTKTCVVDGKKVQVKGKTCPAPTPTPTDTPTCQWQGQQNCVTPQPTATCSWDGEPDCVTPGGGGSASASPTCSFDGENNCLTSPAGANPSPSPTCSFQGETNCASSGTGTGGTGNGGLATSAAATASTAKSGLAVGGVLAVLPGSLLWSLIFRRRRRRAGTR
jgi:membrane peptidoglycan carboxypeptidase